MSDWGRYAVAAGDRNSDHVSPEVFGLVADRLGGQGRAIEVRFVALMTQVAVSEGLPVERAYELAGEIWAADPVVPSSPHEGGQVGRLNEYVRRIYEAAGRSS